MLERRCNVRKGLNRTRFPIHAREMQPLEMKFDGSLALQDVSLSTLKVVLCRLWVLHHFR